MRQLFATALALLVALTLGACAPTPPTVDQRDVDNLALELRGLGPNVDPAEAERAAQIAYSYSQQLAKEYQITDPPLVHNAKVNNGFRPRGLCWHWAEDIEKRLKQENFKTLAMHRAISDPENPFRIDHSTAIISRRGDTMFEGVVLDPWRYGGTLYWSPTMDDTRYNWRPRLEVLHNKHKAMVARREAPIGG